MNSVPKLHFIHCLNYTNVGDWCASPLDYFPDYFIKRYNVMYHHINFIQWNEISPRDAVIIGGGGLFDNEPELQEAINRILDICDCTIAWGVGFHKRSGQEPPSPSLRFSRFKLLTIRDHEYQTGFEYLPCVTCMLPQLRKKKETIRKLGIINHYDYAISGLNYDMISNSASIDEMTDFIAESDSIMTTSFHGAYWSMLMEKKTIIAHVWANKFEHFERKPVFLRESSVNAIDEAISQCDASQYIGWLDECIELNMSFFERVKRELEKHIPNSSNTITIATLLKEQAWASIPYNRMLNDLVKQISIYMNKTEERLNVLETKRNK